MKTLQTTIALLLLVPFIAGEAVVNPTEPIGEVRRADSLVAYPPMFRIESHLLLFILVLFQFERKPGRRGNRIGQQGCRGSRFGLGRHGGQGTYAVLVSNFLCFPPVEAYGPHVCPLHQHFAGRNPWTPW